MVTYTTKLLSNENLDDLRQILLQHQVCQNIISKVMFDYKINSPKELHKRCYHLIRDLHPEITAQVVIKAMRSTLSTYRSIKSNKHKITKPVEFSRLSIQLDKRLYSQISTGSIRITTSNKRKKFEFHLYPKIEDLFKEHKPLDPKIFEKNGHIWIAFTFNVVKEPLKQKQALGVDLGCRRSAATSDGRIIIDKKFNGEKRELRYLKRSLQVKGTKSARRHLSKLRRKERNKNKNQTHLIANEILKTNADTIVLENLKGIKAKKHKFQNKNNISQVPLYDLREKITYKAENQGKTVLLVSPAYTSQIDSVTGQRDGERKGCRYYAKSGLIYDADVNAAVNIGKRSKLPVSQGNLLDGQAVVNRPNVCKSLRN